MSSDSTLTLSALIERALTELHSASQRPLQTTVGSTALTDNVVNTLTVAAGDDAQITAPSVLEAGQELLLVTAKSNDPTPIFTVIRGYAGTPINSSWPSGSPLLIEPTWSRYQVRNAICTGFKRNLNSQMPNLTTAQLAPVSGKAIVEMPANTVEVYRVEYQDPNTGVPHDVDGWDFYDDAGGMSSTGKLIRLRYNTTFLNLFSTSLYVTYQTPYQWADVDNGNALTDSPDEADTIGLPLGAEDLPALYAAAYVLMNREVSRLQLDRTEEWTNDASIRNGISLRYIQQAWTGYYQALDEARQMQNVPRRIRYRARGSL